MKMKWILAAGALAVLTASSAMAGENYGKGERWAHHEKMMEKIDTDGDGSISKAEFMAGHEERFDAMDADGDGSLTSDEMKAAAAERHEKFKERRGRFEKDGENDAE